MDAPTTSPDKAFLTLRARAACLGMQAFRTDADDGRVIFFTVFHGVAKQHIDLTALAARVEDLELEAV